MNRRAVFLDRDGVVLASEVRGGVPRPRHEQPELLPGVGQALSALSSEGFHVLIVTNQPDIARGVVSRAQVDAIHAWLRERLPEVEEIRVCAHDDADGCNCRKPRPGLLQQGGWDFPRSYMIGDRWRDIEAGRAAGCVTVFIDRGYDEGIGAQYDHRAVDLPEAAAWILARERKL